MNCSCLTGNMTQQTATNIKVVNIQTQEIGFENLDSAYKILQDKCSFYAGCPEGRPCLKLGFVSLFFSMVATNLHINLLIKPRLNSALP